MKMMVQADTERSDSSERAPTLREQVTAFHKIMHAFNCVANGGRSDHVHAIVSAMSEWSYSHRVGNGELGEREQQRRVNRAFWHLDYVVRNPRWSGDRPDEATDSLKA